jgi:hypothetical protein
MFGADGIDGELGSLLKLRLGLGLEEAAAHFTHSLFCLADE